MCCLDDGCVADEEDCCDSDDMDMLEDFMDSDVWSVTDLDSYRSDVDEEDCCDSDDRDMLTDFLDSDVWSVTDLDSYRSDVDEEDNCDSDVADLEGLNYLGRNCIMDVSAGGTLSPSESDITGPNGPYVTDGQLAKLGRCPSRPPHWNYWWILAGRCRHPTSPGCCSRLCLLALLAGGGHCPCPTLTLLARMACMLLMAPLAKLGRCPSRPPHW